MAIGYRFQSYKFQVLDTKWILDAGNQTDLLVTGNW